MDPRSCPIRTDGILVERTPNELLAFNDVTGEAHALNEAAAVVWDHCDGTTSLEDMVPLVAAATGLDPDPRVVELAIEELVDAGLIEAGVVGVPALGRRALIKKLGLTAAAAAAALPIVESIVTAGTAGAGPAPGTPIPSPTAPSPIPSPTAPSPVPAPSPTTTPSPTPSPADADNAGADRDDDAGPVTGGPSFTG